MSLLTFVGRYMDEYDREPALCFTTSVLSTGNCHGHNDEFGMTRVHRPVYGIIWSGHQTSISERPDWFCLDCIEEAILEYPNLFAGELIPSPRVTSIRNGRTRKTKRDVTPGMVVMSKYIR